MNGPGEVARRGTTANRAEHVRSIAVVFVAWLCAATPAALSAQGTSAHVVKGSIRLDGAPLLRELPLTLLRWPEQPGKDRYSTTLEAGNFLLPDVKPGSYVLVSIFDRGSIAERVEIADAAQLDLHLHTWALSGRVVDEATGTPINGAYLRAVPEALHAYGDHWSETTNEDGTFQFGENLLEGRWTLTAAAEGYVERSVEIALRDDREIEVELRSHSLLELTILLGDGSPLSRASVRLATKEQLALRRRLPVVRSSPWPALRPPLGPLLQYAQGYEQWLDLDEGGRGTVTAAPQGRYWLEVETEQGTFESWVLLPGPPLEIVLPKGLGAR